MENLRNGIQLIVLTKIHRRVSNGEKIQRNKKITINEVNKNQRRNCERSRCVYLNRDN